MENVSVLIVDYHPIHQPDFEQLNRAWIEQFFWMEPIDHDVLKHPDKHIIGNGGAILMAKIGNEVAGTVALKYHSPGVYEFTKMAVDARFRGKHVGQKLSEAAIEKARALGATKIILYSNTILAPAIALYRKLGFQEVPVDGPYKRSNIKMELVLSDEKRGLTIRIAHEGDIRELVRLGRQTFSETFDSVNTKSDMGEYLSQNFTFEKIAEELRDARNKFFVAESETEALGYAKISASDVPDGLNEIPSIELCRLYAVRAAIGQGVGASLMKRCLHHAKEHGFRSVWLGVWEFNERALAFYDKFGFERFGEHVFMLGKDAQTDLLLKKKI